MAVEDERMKEKYDPGRSEAQTRLRAEGVKQQELL